MSTKGAWTLTSFKLITIMSVLDKKLHVLQNMNVDDDRSMILNVE